MSGIEHLTSVDDFDAVPLGCLNHVLRAFGLCQVVVEVHYKVWLPVLQHLLVADRTSGSAVYVPSCRNSDGCTAMCDRPCMRFCIGSRCASLYHNVINVKRSHCFSNDCCVLPVPVSSNEDFHLVVIGALRLVSSFTRTRRHHRLDHPCTGRRDDPELRV